MLVNNEHRFQFIYFFLSGLVACALLILMYISLKTSANYKLRDDLKSMQKSMEFEKPAVNWNYNNTWKHIGNPKLRHEIYSAYFDPRTDIVDYVSLEDTETLIGSLRIFAIFPTKFRDVMNCVLRYDDFSLREIVAEESDPMNEHHDELFAAYSIMCPLRVRRNLGKVKLPQAVALAYASNRLSHLSPTFIPISYPRNISLIFTKSLPVLSICVGPLQNNYNDALRIAEFVESYRILGASHFYFYHANATQDVLRLLAYYRKKGVADVLPWNINDHMDDVHYAGIVAQFNDCVYRAMVVDNYRYAAVIDLDEILMPLKHNSLLEYLRQCDEGRTSAFVFRNVFFYKKDSNDTFSVPKHTKNHMLYTQTKVRRTLEIMPYYARSKCIVNTRSIIEMGNHRTWRIAPGFVDALVHQTVGLLYHYRDQCINCKMVLIVDYTARRFGSLIWDRVDDTCLRVYMEREGVCPMS